MYARPNPVEPDDTETARRAPLWHRAVAFLLKAALAVALLSGGAWLARDILSGAPVATRSAPPERARLVEVAPARRAATGPVIRAYGEVEAARRLVLRPEIGGRVTEIHPALAPGGEVSEGERLIALDDRDIRLEIAEAEAEIARISARIRIERGQQGRAARDLERSPIRGDITEEQRALILREPQMAELQAELDAAEARLAAARLRREKTVLRAPFDALVESEQVAPGTVLTAGAEAARLAAADRFRVRLAVPAGALDWIATDGSQRVTLAQPGVWPDGATREGRVARLGAGLTETGRMAELIVEVEDPLARRRGSEGLPRLLLGSFLEARIEAPAIEGAVAVDRAWLRDGDRLWVMTADGRLEVRDPGIVWRGAEQVLVTSGVAPGERIVTTPLATWSEGMALRTAGEGA